MSVQDRDVHLEEMLHVNAIIRILRSNKCCMSMLYDNEPVLQSWTFEMEHLDHPSPQIEDGKMARFSLRATSSLIFFWGGGVGGFLLHTYSVRDCNLGHFKWNTDHPPNQRWKNGAFFPSCDLVIDFWRG